MITDEFHNLSIKSLLLFDIWRATDLTKADLLALFSKHYNT